MTVFKTTPEQALKVARYTVAMNAAGLPDAFVADVMRLAQEDQGVFELLELWAEADVPSEREVLIADLQEVLDEEEELPKAMQVKPKIDFVAIAAIAQRVADHKKKIRDLIDRHGGVTAVAKKSGIPQPSLSRMLSSASMPRRTTLYRLAKAMDVEESEVVAEWTR